MNVANLTTWKFARNASIALALWATVVSLASSWVQVPGFRGGVLYVVGTLVIYGLLIFGLHRRNFVATVLLTVVASFAVFGAPYAFVAWLDGETSGAGAALVAVYSALALLAAPALIAITWRMWREQQNEEAA